MDYQGNIIRPPSEANSILLQATLGCSHNKCSFCGAYKDKRFTIKSDDIIFEDIEYAAKHFRYQNRLFICDGDALIIPQKRLIKILERINLRLPQVERIGVYGNAKSIKLKSEEDLKELQSLGLKIVYMGLETGDDITLKAINKGVSSADMIKAGQKIKNANMLLSVTVLLGIAGSIRSEEHALATGKVLSKMNPDYVGALSLMLLPNTPLYKQHENNEFDLINPMQILNELGIMLASTNLTNGLFHANHASNYLPLRVKMPEEKEKNLALIAKALQGKIKLKDEFMRAL